MNQRRWRATWHEESSPREYIFYAPESLALARLDLQLLLIEQGRPVPKHFELSEDNQPCVLPPIEAR